jgi:UDP-N-acetylglucosamine--N-acetylmuramyl-(pentapeptide) pyrophosphoryl-undecaprenol N-acetylglucosamine transferase
VMSDVVPPAIQDLPPDMRARLVICQQAREEDLDRVRSLYRGLNVSCEIQPFYKDMPQRIADSHLVISRSGASTVAELSVIGRPSILVPLPGSLDQDQAANAATLADIGAAIVIPQSEFTPGRLAKEIQDLFADPERLNRAASAAKHAGIADAAQRLAQAVLKLASTSKNGTRP